MLYHKLLYEFLLGPTSYYSLRQSKLVSRFAFEEADWLGLVQDWLTLASDWLRDAIALLSCIGQVIAHNSSVVASMSFHVQGEVVRPAELPRTQMAFEWFLACVFAVVPGQLI